MLPSNQLALLYPFFKRHESDLLRLKNFSKEPLADYSKTIPYPEQFYPWGQRKIFYEVDFTPAETASINDVKSLIIENQAFPVNQFPDQIILRHLHSTGIKPSQAYERLLKIHNIFKQQNANSDFVKYITPENYLNLEGKLNSGLIYTYGKSLTGLPLIILQLSKLNSDLSSQQNFATFYTLISIVLHHRMRPHHQEKYIFIIDLNGMSFGQIPYQYMFSFVNWIGLIFGGLAEKIFVFHSEKIGILWQMCKRWLPESTVNKVLFVANNSLEQVHQMISPQQLEQKYGGSLGNLKEFYPPKIPQQKSKLILDLSSLQEDNHSETTEYFSFKDILMRESVQINRTYKSLGITTKKQIQAPEDEEYKIQKEEFSSKLNGLCGIKGNEQCNCTIF